MNFVTNLFASRSLALDGVWIAQSWQRGLVARPDHQQCNENMKELCLISATFNFAMAFEEYQNEDSHVFLMSRGDGKIGSDYRGIITNATAATNPSAVGKQMHLTSPVLLPLP